jgi:uncharacterized membrane protein YeaQ/YmgE (transglycosylase-associated protein family)
MLQLIGLSHLSDKELLLLLFIAICFSLAVGWIIDMIMRRIGFGIFGNAFICMFGVMLGLGLYNRFYGRMTSPEPMMVMAFALTSIMLLLVVISVLRRVLRM